MTFSGVEEAIGRVAAATGNAPRCDMVNYAHPTELEPGLTSGGWIARLGGFMPNAVAMESWNSASSATSQMANPT